jgi:hypothetical protein
LAIERQLAKKKRVRCDAKKTSMHHHGKSIARTVAHTSFVPNERYRIAENDGVAGDIAVCVTRPARLTHRIASAPNSEPPVNAQHNALRNRQRNRRA